MNETTKTNAAMILAELHDDDYNSELWEYSLSTEAFLKGTSCDEIEMDDLLRIAYPNRSDDFYDKIVHSVENDTYAFPSNWADELPENWIRHATENTYNHENNLSNDFVYTVVSPQDETEWYHSRDTIYVIVSVLGGGDPRCNQNYHGCRVFVYENAAAEAGFFDWVFGWHLCDYETGDEMESDKYEIGYSSNPTSHLDDDLEGTFYDSESDTLYGLLDGKIVVLYPFAYHAEVERV